MCFLNGMIFTTTPRGLEHGRSITEAEPPKGVAVDPGPKIAPEGLTRILILPAFPTVFHPEIPSSITLLRAQIFGFKLKLSLISHPPSTNFRESKQP
ncbi:hypothetical protein PtA15_9A115 [Puccinia triticina]|uniref:Uncharacterized protein n=1 Tax=Puccinia triticina TaxID=208348 RepID=A0ABY7CTH8_9BASI|nr:uncharacterized protein PtA15_9A115 [Puccinia triticina]WAQ87990.1 hypothetical protein PtA15_9A115 [Puccinia triticina]